MIGELRHRIIIQKQIISTNVNGFEKESWEDHQEVWAAVSNLHGREFFAAAQVQAENTVKFTIRFLSGIDTKMRISFQDKYFNITAVDNIKYKNKYIEIKAQEVEDNDSQS